MFVFGDNLDELTDKQLEDLYHRCHEEKVKRAEMKVYPAMNDQEKDLWKTGGKSLAIIGYKQRNNLSILEAKTAVEREMK